MKAEIRTNQTKMDVDLKEVKGEMKTWIDALIS
jgi:hypothetical protein